MKKKILLLLMGVFSLGLLDAQVGINIMNPQGIFHIDGKGNTTVALTSTELEDDVIMSATNSGGLSISVGGSPKPGASLSLDSNKKAFLPNRVSLVDIFDVLTVNNPRQGSIVYNTADSGVIPDNVTPGYYMYEGTSWVRLSTTAYSRLVKTLGLEANVATKASSLTNAAYASVLNFGDLTVYDGGSYAYTFQFSGTTDTNTVYLMGATYYLYIMRKGVNDSAYSIADYAEITQPVYGSGDNVTNSITLGAVFKTGDNVQVRIGHGGTTPRVWTLLKDVTTIMYWKL